MTDLDDVDAQLTAADKEILYSIPERTGGGLYYNIGDGRWGGSTILMALGLKERNLSGHIWTVDTYHRYNPSDVAKYSTKHEVDSYITRCKGRSSEWEDKLKDKWFEFIFIDGGHQYECALEDAAFAMTHSNLIGFHDTNMNRVSKAIQDSGILEWRLIHDVVRTKVFERVSK